jgi:tetratricopeptide (TPR) repeat protein
VLFQFCKFSVAAALVGIFGLTPARMLGQDAQPAAQAPQKNFKDRAEYDLYDAISKDTNAKTRLDKLQQWEKQYPQTEWLTERRTMFITTYAALNQPKETTDAAKALLASDPKNFTALYYVMYFTQVLYSQTKSNDALDQGEQAANTILANIGTPPPGVKAEDWAKLRPQIELLADVNLGYIDMTRSKWDAAETEFGKSLQLSPNNGQVDYWLAFVITSEKKVDRIPAAMFYYARAGTFEGQGAADPATRKTALDFVKRQYKTYHGSDEGFDALIAAAKASPTPPADLKIVDAVSIEKAKFANEEEWTKAHPEEALWKTLKAALTGADGANYFGSSMKDSQVPTLKAKVVSLEPASKPKTVLVAVEDGTNNTDTADATLKFETALPGKVEPGTELTFEGVPQSYNASPLMVVFNVDKDKLHGWTGKNAAPAPVHHKPRAKTSASK